MKMRTWAVIKMGLICWFGKSESRGGFQIAQSPESYVIGGNKPFKLSPQNTISPSIGVLFFTYHTECSRLFSPGHQIIFLSADDLTSYFTEKIFSITFYPPQIFSLLSCFGRDVCSFPSSFSMGLSS